ncbi:hypothetical protein OCOL_001728 [Ordospora colligata]
MDAQNQIKRNLKNNYILIEFLMFVTRTVVLAFAIHENPYLSITKGIQGAWINTIFIDITNIFQFIFIFDVIQRENIFQMLLYIPIIMYAMLIILATILNAEIIEFKTGAVNGRARFLYAYTGILAFEILIHIPVYKKLKAGFMWSNFKKIGADPKMNGKLKHIIYRSLPKKRGIECNQEAYNCVCVLRSSWNIFQQG